MQRSFIKATMVIFGSWWSVLGHIVIFIAILALSQDLLFFNTFVSIEAIFIGIFILMAESRQEDVREVREKSRRAKDRQLVKEDVDITQHVMAQIEVLKKDQLKILKHMENRSESS